MEDLVDYSFFVICNNNDPKHFHIEATCMRDYRLRFSAMKSTYKRYLKGRVDYKSYFKIFAGDYSYHLLDRGLCHPKDVPEIVQEMTKKRLEKFRDTEPRVATGVVTFDKSICIDNIVVSEQSREVGATGLGNEF